MDVDLLRPGTVPISPETVLWFEFLLDPDLLRKHLNKPRPDPIPTELIIKFTNAVLESIKNDTKKMEVDQTETVDVSIEPKPQDSLKNLALKILTLKVVAYLKWNLDILDTKLPLKIQINVLQDLFYFTNEKTEIPNVPECDVTAVSDPFLFALILYHRWIVRMAVQQNFHAKMMKPASENIVNSMEEFYMFTNELVTSSVNFLNSVLTHGHYPHVLMFDTFKMLTEDSKDVEHDWDKSLEISPHEYESQIHYDLGCLLFNRENYDLAKQHFLSCDAAFRQIKDFNDLKYASFDMKYLKGYLCACNVPVDGHTISLLQQMNASIADQYTGIIPILQKDNLQREIPMVYRTILELDIQGALSSGKFTVAKGLLLQVQMLNVIRNALDGKTSSSTDFIHRIKHGGPKATEMLFWAANCALEKGTLEDKTNIKKFFMKTFMAEDLPELLESLMGDEKLKNLLNNDDLNQISQTQTKIDDLTIPPSLLSNDWIHPNFSQKRNPYLETKILEQKLISCYNPSTIKDLITQLNSTNPSKPIWRLNSSWELAIPLHSVVVSMPRSPIQDLSFVLLAKSKEMMIHRDYEKSQELLTVLENEIKAVTTLNANIVYKLTKLISWEMLLIKITDLFLKWPGNPQGRETLIAQCKQCLSALEDRNDSVLPRSEVVERCALCLLNCGEWEYLCGLEKRWNYFEMAAAVAYACQDLSKYKGSKKVSRDMWDLVLPIFGLTMSQSKRTSTGNTTMVHRDSPNANNKSHLLNFLSNLRDLTALSVVISMLARLYNVLRDEPNLELNIQYITLWPAVISNANAYNTHAVFEILLDLTQQALKFYPNNIAWLRLIADLNYGNSHYETALCNYIESIIIATDYFNQPICKTSVDEHVIKRMIKCCTNINCHTQAAILTQFLDETDYSLAFKCLSESKTLQVCYDSVDAYYGCIWDTTLLEYLVHLHHKRGEHQRKQQAIKQIGTLELNSNNNEEIQREAINTRKSRFMRALAKQFLTKTV